MNTDEVLQYFGSRLKVTSLLGITRQNFNQWVRLKRIPKHHQLNLEEYTKGALKADENCRIQNDGFVYKAVLVKRQPQSIKDD